MATNETYGDGRPVLLSGVYRHPDSGQELVAQATSKFGNPMADAFTRLGFEYVGPANFAQPKQTNEKAELYAAEDPFGAPSVDTSPNARSVGELEAELAAAKERQAERDKAMKNKSSLALSDKEAQKQSSQTETQPVRQNPPKEAPRPEAQSKAKGGK